MYLILTSSCINECRKYTYHMHSHMYVQELLLNFQRFIRLCWITSKAVSISLTRMDTFTCQLEL